MSVGVSMKSLKSLFISGQITLAVGSVAVAIWLTIVGNPYGLALLLPALPLLIFLARLFLFPPARTSTNLPWVFWPTLVGAVVVVVLFAGGKACSLMSSLAVLNLLGVYLYIRWYSRYQQRPLTAEIGKVLPPVSFSDLNGNLVTPESFAGHPVILMFYRGNWCPLCMAQIREIAEQYQSLQEKGVRVALVSPQSHTQSAALAKQFSVQFDFLRDDNNQSARTLGIIDEGGTPAGLEVFGYDSDTVMPTVLILDREGRLVYQHLTDNYRVRPEPSLFMAVLKERGLI